MKGELFSTRFSIDIYYVDGIFCQKDVQFRTKEQQDRRYIKSTGQQQLFSFCCCWLFSCGIFWVHVTLLMDRLFSSILSAQHFTGRLLRSPNQIQTTLSLSNYTTHIRTIVTFSQYSAPIRNPISVKFFPRTCVCM